MSNTERLSNELAEAYADEVASALNYLTHAKRLEGFFGEQLADDLQKDFSEELVHAERIADVLDETFDVIVPPASEIQLDRQPYFEMPIEYDSSEDAVKAVLRATQNAESDAIERYSRIVQIAEEAGYPDIRRFAEELLADERTHLDETESLLAQFE